MANLPSGFALTLISLLLSTYLMGASALNRRGGHLHLKAHSSQNIQARSYLKPKYMGASHFSYSSHFQSSSSQSSSSQSSSSQSSNSQSSSSQSSSLSYLGVASQYATGSHPMVLTFLEEHNKVRDTYRVPRLTWNSQLVPSAQQLADACAFKHTDNNPYGENIAAGQASPREVVLQWVDGPEEKAAYDPRKPVDSHFTQVVWESSREVGCAVTSCPTMAGVSLPQSPIQFWVCEYNPPGNVETLYLKNVHATAGGSPARR